MSQSRVVSLESHPPDRRGVGRLIHRSSRSGQLADRPDGSAILESLDDAVVARGLDGVISNWNSGAERLFGYSAAEMLGEPYDLIVPRIHRDQETDMLTWAARAELSDSYATARLCKDGTQRNVSVQIAPIRDSAGVVVGVATVEHEAREARRVASWAPEVGAYLSSAFEDAPIGTGLVGVYRGSEGNLLRVNRALCELTGYSAQTLEERNIRNLIHPDDAETDLAMTTKLATGELAGFELEQRVQHAAGYSVWVTLNASLVRDAAGNPLFCIRQMQDIEERKRFEGELGYLVEHDPLTGLLNRRGFVREVTQALAYARRYGGGGALLFLDLDDFKEVNDTRGHIVGDEVLSETARVVLHRLRETDIFARIGGDEFAILLPHTDASDAQVLCASLLSAVREAGEAMLGVGRGITMSVGVTAYRQPAKDLAADDLLMEADMAMYAAKEGGRDRLAVAGPTTHARTQSRITWAERLKRATAEAGFELYCQPILDLVHHNVAQWELLSRLPGDDGAMILPAQFLHTAERGGLIAAIDRWVLGEAMRLIAEQRDAGRELQLGVNLSGRSIGEPELLATIEAGLRTTGIDPASLVVEVSETVAIANIERARSFATKLSAIGCRFALDGFGASFGSVYYLKHIPFDFLKIDGEFTRNITASATDLLILDAIVHLSKGLGKHTIAEFVGDQRTVEALRAHGVDYAQGYHLGRPIPVSEAFAA
jgi:diguanylate cyclase (GGDEF)-like protein/PAS domain S-box-containing protein